MFQRIVLYFVMAYIEKQYKRTSIYAISRMCN
jgi:hypothetical protein